MSRLHLIFRIIATIVTFFILLFIILLISNKGQLDRTAVSKGVGFIEKVTIQSTFELNDDSLKNQKSANGQEIDAEYKQKTESLISGVSRHASQEIEPASSSETAQPLRPKILELKVTDRPDLVSCKPNLSGYTSQQVTTFFEKKTFPNCALKLKGNPILKINENSLVVSCNGTEGRYFLGSSPENERFGRVEYVYDEFSFSGNQEIQLKNREFVMIECSNTIKTAYIKHRFSQRASDRSRKITQELLRNYNTQEFRPLGVHMIMLDSVSRPHFYRNLKSTIEYLNEKIVDSQDFVVYDFKLNHAITSKTRANLVALLLGADLDAHAKRISELNYVTDNFIENYKKIQEDSLWKHYERFGFVTFFGFDTTLDFFNYDIGKIVHTDHAMLNFWNVAKVVFGYSDFIIEQRCFGHKNAHRYLLDYQTEFTRSYKGHNKFSYVHTSVAHEESGTVITTLDEDLKDSIEALINYYQTENEDFLIVLAGDHGRAVGEWDMAEEGIQENRNPLHLVITSQGLINKIGKNTHATMMHNTQRLVSRFDWHVSLLQMAAVPYVQVSEDSSLYRDFKQKVPANESVSVFLEKIKDKRTCSDVMINKNFCFCGDYQPLDLSSEFVNSTMAMMIYKNLEYVNSFINLRGYCKKLSIGRILEASELVIKEFANGGNRHVKVVFSVKEDKDAKIEVLFYGATIFEYKRMQLNFYDRPLVEVKIKRDENIYMYALQMESAKRVDGVTCSESLLKGIADAFCVC